LPLRKFPDGVACREPVKAATTKLPGDSPRSSCYRRSLSEKIVMVRESLQPGTTAAHVAKKHGVALNVLYYWRKAYRDLVDTELSGVAPDEDAPSSP